jgi:lipopolysaccharide biosynthesis glycosyltransferase
MRIFIGYDNRENEAFEVARSTAQSFGCQVTPIYEDQLRAQGLLTRPVDRRGGMFDLASSAPQSTQFAISRFFVPLLAHSGWCLFTDCDVVFLRDPKELLKRADDRFAVMVVKHPSLDSVDDKMDSQVQTLYKRKNWSSVMLINCDHPGNRRLNLSTLNQWPGRDLHAFSWLADSEIGELSQDYNWLVNVRLPPANPAIAHFTLGGPWIPGWEGKPYDELWIKAQREHSQRVVEVV